MKPSVWAARFEKRVRRLQVELGLLDWNFAFKTLTGGGDIVAMVNMDRECREAVFTVFLRPHVDSPERIAFHEVLHVLLNEPLELSAERGNHNHRDVGIEEHRAIERLVNWHCGRP